MQISRIFLGDTRYLETLLNEIALLPTSEISKSDSKSNDFCIASAHEHTQHVIDNFCDKSDESNDCPEVPRLQCISCHLQNSLVPNIGGGIES